MIVSITLVSNVLDVVVGGGGWPTAPVVGMSPAKIEVDSAHISASAIANRFIGVAPFELRKCQQVYIKNNGTATHDFLQGGLERFNIRFAFAQLLANRKSQILMRTASPKLDISHLTPNERAELRCRTALELKDRGEYEAARDAMFPLWKGIGSRPNTKGLDKDVVPRVLLCAGILTGWLGGPSGIKEADNYARDLITESVRLFEAIGDTRKVAEARAELAQSYWRVGDNDTARILLTTALERLTLAAMHERTLYLYCHRLSGQSRATKRFLGFLLRTRLCLKELPTTQLKALITISLGSHSERLVRHQRSEVIISTVRSWHTVPQTNISEPPSMLSFVLTSRTTLEMCCVNYIVSKRRTTT
jgi:hypothetical protein